MAMIEICCGDLTRQRTDAIVNAANSDLVHGGGVALAIARAAGPELLAESAEEDFVPTGEAVVTTGGNLHARYVIHAVGPIWRGGEHDEAELLAAAYRRSIELATGLALASIAFPSISTGTYGYPLVEAAPVALSAVREALDAANGVVACARFCLFTPSDEDAYLTAADAAGIDIVPMACDD